MLTPHPVSVPVFTRNTSFQTPGECTHAAGPTECTCLHLTSHTSLPQLLVPRVFPDTAPFPHTHTPQTYSIWRSPPRCRSTAATIGRRYRAENRSSSMSSRHRPVVSYHVTCPARQAACCSFTGFQLINRYVTVSNKHINRIQLFLSFFLLLSFPEHLIIIWWSSQPQVCILGPRITKANQCICEEK